ncbi:metal-dependent phosphohydrolase [Malaciobacter halophilus]|nr:metal-dependent phosphohydrolase [Malaciobacter halophilus]
MSTTESYLRILVGVVLFILSLINNWNGILIFSVIFAYTGVIRYCTFYRVFNLNKKIVLESLYLKYLPKYNPNPILMLDKIGNIVFRNNPAKKELGLDDLLKFFKDEPITIIKENKSVDIKYKTETGKYFLINLQGVSKINYILAYATDITEVVKAEEEIINTQKDIVYTMGAIGETRSNETGNHVKRVALYSEILALKYGLSKEEAELLKLASPMHDIGKVGIKDEILNKPGKLTPKEFSIMKTHSKLGFNMLKNSDKKILKTAAIVAYEHHEKWDGTGYPRKLKGKDIHIYGRITAVADVFDALGSKRVYKAAWSLDEIFKLFKEQRGKHFDPLLVDIFFENFDEFDEIRKKYIDK